MDKINLRTDKAILKNALPARRLKCYSSLAVLDRFRVLFLFFDDCVLNILADRFYAV